MALTMNAMGTNLAGDSRVTILALTPTMANDTTAAATTMAESDVTSRWARKSASRSALPPTNCAVTAAAASMAARKAGSKRDFEGSSRDRGEDVIELPAVILPSDANGIGPSFR